MCVRMIGARAVRTRAKFAFPISCLCMCRRVVRRWCGRLCGCVRALSARCVPECVRACVCEYVCAIESETVYATGIHPCARVRRCWPVCVWVCT